MSTDKLIDLAATLTVMLRERGAGKRKAMALSSSGNVDISLVIATGSFPGTPAVTAAMVFAIFQTIRLALAATSWGQFSHVETGAGREVAV